MVAADQSETRLAVEPPVFLTGQARRSLEEDRRRLVEEDAGSKEINGAGTGKDAQQMLNILERAWLDESRTAHPPELPLSERLQKLWAERGDFSRFRGSDLIAELKRKGKGLDDESTSDKDATDDFGADVEGLEQVEAQTAEDADATQEQADHSAAAASTDVMSIEDMRQLRTQMLEKLGVAQTSLFFGHALVSLLINSTKVGATGSEGSASGSRFGSPAIGAGKPTGASGPASVTHRSVATQQEQALGSATSLEAELGIEPHVFGASRIQSMQRELEKPRAADEQEEGADAQDGEDGDVESMEKDLRKRLQADTQLLDDEVEDRTREIVDTYQGKVDGIRSAIDILKRGAATLQQDTSSTRRDHIRWAGLQQAKQGGWGLTPGKPIRGTASKQRELLDVGVYRKRDEPSRDAWIGYAMPESNAAYRRRALAYFSHAEPASEDPSDALLFASRSGKRLRVEITLGDERWCSSIDEKEIHKQDNIDSLLRTAQGELADAELFDMLVSEVRSLSSHDALQARIVDTDCVAIQVTPAVTLRFAMVDMDSIGEDQSTSSDPADASPLANMLLAMLRLGLVQRYRESVGIARGKISNKDRLLQPILGLIHYASFVAATRNLLAGLQAQYRAMHYDMPDFASLDSSEQWVGALLLGSDVPAFKQETKTNNVALSQLGANASIYIGQTLISQIAFSYPSRIHLTIFKGASVYPDRDEKSQQELGRESRERAVQLADLDLDTTRQIIADALESFSNL